MALRDSNDPGGTGATGRAASGAGGDTSVGHVDLRVQCWRDRTSTALTVLAIGSLPLVALDFIRDDLTDADRMFIDIVDVMVFAAFAVDYLVQLVLSPRRLRFVRVEWVQLLLVLSQGLAIVPALTHLGWLRVVRVPVVVRPKTAVVRISSSAGVASHRGRQFLRRHSARFALSIAGFTWMTAAVAFTIAEDVSGNDGQSFGDGLWWALTTLTTVGYGDVTAATPAGRIVGGLTMLIGVGSFAVVTASIAQFLLRPDDGPSPDVGVAESHAVGSESSETRRNETASAPGAGSGRLDT